MDAFVAETPGGEYDHLVSYKSAPGEFIRCLPWAPPAQTRGPCNAGPLRDGLRARTCERATLGSDAATWGLCSNKSRGKKAT